MFSEEIKNEGLSNEKFVERLYLTLMDRPAWPEEITGWAAHLYNGYPREDIFAGFSNSDEFQRVCTAAGIIRGSYTPPPGGAIRVFIPRMFKTILGRDPSAAELSFWFEALRSGKATGASLVYELFFSSEVINKGLTDTAFVDLLFNTTIGRTISSAERNYWVAELNNSSSRFNILVRLVGTTEFERICREYDVTRGPAPQPTNSMTTNTMIAKVWNLIIAAHFKGISDRPEHVAGIMGNLQSEAGPSLCPFQVQVSNQVGLGLMQWSFGRRVVLENYMWSNGISRDAFYTEMHKHTHTYNCNPLTNHPQDMLDKVLEVQINFMFHEFRTTSERLYLNYIDFPENRTGIPGARAYAELFCSLSLRPGAGTGEINDIRDEGVIQALQASPYVGGAGRLDRISYSALDVRRNRAAAVYQQFLNNHR